MNIAEILKEKKIDRIKQGWGVASRKKRMPESESDWEPGDGSRNKFQQTPQIELRSQSLKVSEWSRSRKKKNAGVEVGFGSMESES